MNAKPSWFKMKAENGVGFINILGDIGGWGTDYRSFQASLDALGPVNEIRMNINSDGGEVHNGFAIYNALAMHPATKTITVMGLAASMASVVAMAGDRRIMPANAMMMIHNPVGGIQGQADEIISYGEAVAKMRDNIAETYSMASDGKLSKSKAIALMDDQSWLDAGECLALGLCTEVSAPSSTIAKINPTARASHIMTVNKFNTKESVMKTKTNDEAIQFEDDATKALVAEATKAARTELLAQQKQVGALCRIAGRPELAAKFNEDGKTADEVVAELDTLGPASKGKGTGAARAEGDVEINPRRNIDTGNEPVLSVADIYSDYNHPGRITARKEAARSRMHS